MRICGDCNSETGNGLYIQRMGVFWHPECFRCHGCEEPISDLEFSVADNRSFHKNCYKELYHPRCDVCKHFIPLNVAGLIEFRAHPFWDQKYCPSHEHDGTTRCCSCERMEPLDAKYLVLDDDRKLCLECSDSAIMDTHQCRPLYLQIQRFYKRWDMEVEEQIPLLLVEAMEGEKSCHQYLSATKGLCLSEEQSVPNNECLIQTCKYFLNFLQNGKILRQPRFGKFRIIDMFMEPYRLIRRCEVTAILVLYGLPRLLTGSILAHEMMHAWLRLNGYFNLSADVEEGMCQVLAHIWLDSQSDISGIGRRESESPVPSTTKVIFDDETYSYNYFKQSAHKRKLRDFFMQQIESHSYTAYREGFKEAKNAVDKYGLKKTLSHIRLIGCFPP